MQKIIRHAISLILITMCAIQVSGCNNDSIPSLSAPEFQKQIQADTVQLLDVRTPQEYAEGHIDGALNIDVLSEDFRDQAARTLSKEEPVLVYCRSGRRSMQAARTLTALGYKAINLDGGILAWQSAHLPLTPPH